MEFTTKATAPSPGQPPQSSLSGGQGGAKNLPVQPSDTLTTNDTAPGTSSGFTSHSNGLKEPKSLNYNPMECQKPGTSSQIVGKKESNNSNKSSKNKNNKDTRPTVYRNDMNLFNQLSMTDQFFKIEAKDGTNLSTIDTITAYEELKKLLKGEPKKITERRDGGLTIVSNNEDQCKALASLKCLAGKEVNCIKDDKFNQSQGTIRYENHPGHTIETIKECLERYNVKDVYQMTKRNDNRDIVKLPLYILTFGTTKLPPKVNIGWTHCPVRLYIPKPRRCFKCQRFGHGSANCRSISEICPTCSLEAHEGDCTTAAKCRNCEENHPTYSRKCPIFIKEQEILAVKARNNLSYAEARREVSNKYIEPNLTYSQAVSSRSQTTTTKPRSETNKAPVNLSQPESQPSTKTPPIFYQTVNQSPPNNNPQLQTAHPQPQTTKDHHQEPSQKDTNNNNKDNQDQSLEQEQTNISRARKTQKPKNQPVNERSISSKRHMEHKDSSLERYPKRNNDKQYPIQMHIPTNLPKQTKHPQ